MELIIYTLYLEILKYIWSVQSLHGLLRMMATSFQNYQADWACYGSRPAGIGVESQIPARYGQA